LGNKEFVAVWQGDSHVCDIVPEWVSTPCKASLMGAKQSGGSGVTVTFGIPYGIFGWPTSSVRSLTCPGRSRAAAVTRMLTA